jgi:prephenate dehydratase
MKIPQECRVPEPLRVAIQGELGSNSHMAAVAITRDLQAATAEIVPCALSADVFEALGSGLVQIAVLPIENSLHGSVAEHYDLLLQHPVRIIGESLLRIRHHVIAAPGVQIEEIRQVMSHPVALSQCRHWLRDHPEIEALPFYDTAGSVKQVMASGRRDLAGIAPAMAASQYGAEVLVAGIEDHPDNYTRFLLLAPYGDVPDANKLSVAFSVEHRPGTLLAALEVFRQAGVNLTRIESRPVHGRPWEYIFFVDVRFDESVPVDDVLLGLSAHCQMLKELGRYRAAGPGLRRTIPGRPDGDGVKA